MPGVIKAARDRVHSPTRFDGAHPVQAVTLPTMPPPVPLHGSLPEPTHVGVSAAPDQAADITAAPEQQAASPQLSTQGSPSFDSDQENIDREAYSLPQQSAANR